MPPSSTLLLLLLRQRTNRRRSLTFRQQLTSDGKHRRDRGVLRPSLQAPHMSAFSIIISSGNDQALITLTGLDFDAFHHLLPSFSTFYSTYSPYGRHGRIRRLPQRVMRVGRPRSMTPTQCLALVLTWNRTRGSEMVLCLLFGITRSVASLFLRFGRRILLKILAKDDQAAIKMPVWTR